MAEKKTYQELSRELDTVLANLQVEDISIDEAMDLYQRGLQLTGKLEAYLQEAENKITKIKADFSS